MAELLWFLANKDGTGGKLITNEKAQSLSKHQRVGRLYTLGAAMREGRIITNPKENIEELHQRSFKIVENHDPHKNAKWSDSEEILDNPLGERMHKGEKKLLQNKLRKVVQEKKEATDASEEKKKRGFFGL